MSKFLDEAKTLMTSRATRHLVNRRERIQRQDFLNLGVTDERHAWAIMLTLEDSDECPNSPTLDHDGSGDWVHEYEKQMPNGVWAYVKIKIKNSESKCVAISFHPVEKGPRKFSQ